MENKTTSTGWVYIAFAKGDTKGVAVKIGYTNGTIQKRESYNDFVIIEAVGIEQTELLHDRVGLLQAVEACVHWKLAQTGRLVRVSNDWFISSSLDLCELVEEGILAQIIRNTFAELFPIAPKLFTYYHA